MLIGLHGRAGAGKDTVYERLVVQLVGTSIKVQRVSFADKLYMSAAMALGVTPDFLRHNKQFSTALVTVEAPLPEEDPRHPGQVIISQLTVREYLQLYGTEAHRVEFGDDFWVNAVSLDHSDNDLVVVTDCRFANEADAIRDHMGDIVMIKGSPEVEAILDDHPSEHLFASEECDFIINNSVRDDNFESLDAQLALLVEDLRG